MSAKLSQKFSAVTSFNLKTQSYGIDMLESYFKFWPDECILFACLEETSNLDDKKVKDKINILNFDEEIPEYRSFAAKYFHKNNDKNYRFDALKFAHKIFAIQKAISLCKTQYLIWLDADIKTVKVVNYKFLNSLVKPNHYMSYLGREHVQKESIRYSETGFMIFDLYHKHHKAFWSLMDEMYKGGKLFNLDEWTDSWVLDHVRKHFEKSFKLKNINLCDFGLKDVGNESHVFVGSILGDYMDHKKGPRKFIKWSKEFITRYKLNLK